MNKVSKQMKFIFKNSINHNSFKVEFFKPILKLNIQTPVFIIDVIQAIRSFVV